MDVSSITEDSSSESIVNLDESKENYFKIGSYTWQTLILFYYYFTKNLIHSGSRPSIPDVFELSKELTHIIELFYVCTNEDPEARPSAKTIHGYIEMNMKK